MSILQYWMFCPPLCACPNRWEYITTSCLQVKRSWLARRFVLTSEIKTVFTTCKVWYEYHWMSLVFNTHYLSIYYRPVTWSRLWPRKSTPLPQAYQLVPTYPHWCPEVMLPRAIPVQRGLAPHTQGVGEEGSLPSRRGCNSELGRLQYLIQNFPIPHPISGE